MLTVLNIDDSSIDFRLTRSQIITVSEDMELLWADSGAAALETIETTPIDCILCDYQMPDVNGIEFLLSLRKRKIDIPFIFFTGQGNELVAAEALRNGADDYFTKDIEFAQYQRIVNSIKRVVKSKKEKEKQAQLEIEARKFKLISDEANHGNIIVNGADRIVYANKMMAKMQGERVESLIGRKMHELFAKGYLNEVSTLKETLSQHGKFEAIELWHQRRDGEEFPVIASGMLIDDEGGKGDYIVYTAMDISQRKATLKALEESENNFRLLVEEGPLAYQSLDHEGRFIDVNNKWLQIFGYKREEVVGRSFAEFIMGEEAQQFKENFAEFAAKGEIHNVNYKIKASDGKVYQVDISGRVSFDAKGHFVQTNCILLHDNAQ